MIEQIAIAVSLCLVATALIAAKSSGRTLLHPVVLFTLVWLCVFSALPLHILPYLEIRSETYVAILSANTGVVVGALFQILRIRRGKVRPSPLSGGPDLELALLRRLIWLFMLSGSSLFFLYLVTVARQFGLDVLLASPHLVRGGFSGFSIQVTIKYFYFTTPAAAMAFIHYNLTRRYRRRMLTVIAVSLVVSVATTGRTAPITILVWLTFIRLYVQKPLRPLENAKKIRLAVVCAAAVVSVFVYGGNWIGKTFDNSGFQSKITLDTSWNATVIPYYYFTASVPAFNNLLLEPGGRTLGVYTFLPLAKIILPLASREAPAEIAPETFVPYSANTYTYAYPFVRDFGVAGLLAGSIAIGLISQGAYLRMVRANRSVTTVLRCSFLTKCLVFTFGTNHFCSPFGWWCVGLTFVLGAYIAHQRKRLWSHAAGRPLYRWSLASSG